ncbi:NAD(P)/FAD-dependent oxidoreductase [Bacteroides sp. 519]|uniref:phytoene desaturase family protein n=1 Tax=Bacteroides sp. 519 TaxID=2302937 RepID=UPI0013D1205E|nr:NAD(P)/FAD-dependent oxidoreductase [Bacteroides sp. 519]NDV60705.1 NAD(P)/FAD-dependent oxidoreductase [Bacteroides sp. 519]
MSKHDIIIAGSGLGGLECAAILSKEGYNVCVLEKNQLFGGCFQTYKRNGRLLDTGIHYIGSMDEGQVLNQYFRYFGIMDKLNIRKLDADGFDRICFKDNVYNYANGHSNFVETLVRQFPDEREALNRYVSMLKDVGKLISIENLKKGIIAQQGMQYFGMSAAGYISNITPNPELQKILAATSLLYGGVKDVSTFYHHGMINNSYIEGAWRFLNGSMQVSTELIKVIRANGGTVLNNHEVTRIIVENETVKGVEVNNNEVFESKYVISNIHPKRTFELTDKSRSIKNAYLSRINSLENTYGIFTVYLIMKKNTCPYINRNIYIHNDNEVWYDKQLHGGKTTCCMISMQNTDPNSKHAEVISILTPMYMDEVLRWQDTRIEKRGDDYIEFKEKKTKEVLTLIRKYGFDFDRHIEAIYTTSPLSYRDYTATANGSAYGIIKDYRRPQVGFISVRTKLENLLLTGQNLNVHGALGVTLTAMITCSELLGEEYLAKKIGNA